MSKDNLMNGINERSSWREMTPGAYVYGSGNSEEFITGAWRTEIPVWDEAKCKQCLLCFVVCPDSSIPVENSKRKDFDFDHCKGCGICVNACPFHAISIHPVGEEEKA